MCIIVTLLHNRDWCNVVNQLYCGKKLKKIGNAALDWRMYGTFEDVMFEF